MIASFHMNIQEIFTMRNRAWIAGTSAVFLLLIFGFVFRESLGGIFSQVDGDVEFEEIAVQKDMFVDPLDGLLYEEYTSSTLYGVVLDNAPEAWPHYGLSEASVVWEFPVEGARTRLLALFKDVVLEKDIQMGPVRSVRPYFLDVLNAFGAFGAHVGGSPAALDMIAQGEATTLNQFYHDSYFWRDGSRYAPHNVMTSGLELLEAGNDWEIEAKEFIGWKFGEPEVADVSAPSWVFGELDIDWKFEDGLYERHVGGSSFLDADDQRVRVSNVVLVFAPMEIVDAEGRRRIITIGEGDAIVYAGGKRTNARWARDEGGVMRFFDDEGEVVFSRGKTWVSILPVGWYIQSTIIN